MDSRMDIKGRRGAWLGSTGHQKIKKTTYHATTEMPSAQPWPHCGSQETMGGDIPLLLSSSLSCTDNKPAIGETRGKRKWLIPKIKLQQ